MSLQVLLRIVAAAVAAFITSAIWYTTFADVVLRLREVEVSSIDEPAEPWLMIAELARNLVLATVLAHLAQKMSAQGLRCTTAFALILWLGFPVTILAGSVMWESVPGALALIHAGDWLIKLMLISAILILGAKRGEPDWSPTTTVA